MKPRICCFYAVFLLLLTGASCTSFKQGFDITERVHFSQNGSGAFRLSINLNRLRAFRKVLAYANRYDAKKHQLIRYNPTVRAMMKKLRKIPGISNVISNITKNQQNQVLHYSLKFHFKSMAALNQAMRIIYQHIDPPNFTYFKMHKTCFIREDSQGIVNQLAYYKKHDDSLVRGFDLAFFFKDATYKMIYSFDQKIKKATYANTLVQHQEKKIKIIHALFPPKKKPASLRTKIWFKRKKK